MLFSYKNIHNHPTRKLNQHLKYFFRQLRNVNRTSNFLPLNQHFHPDFVTHLNTSPVLRQKFENFFNAFKISSSQNRVALIEKFYSSQDIKDILENVTFNGNNIKKLVIPKRLRSKVSELFGHMYPRTLNSIGNLTDHYTQMYNLLASKVCPFCGVEQLQLPHYARQDYDHMLNQGNYPFAIVNMNNLAPMGDQCNRTYKRGKDVLYNGINRRQYAFPYSTFFNIEVLLDGSLLPDRNANFNGAWVVNFAPNNDYVSTWADVFEIRYRYGELILSTHFDSWIDHFISDMKARAIVVTTNAELIAQFNIDANLYLERPHLEFNIVKGGLFRFLANCNDLAFYTSIIIRINA